MASTQMNAKRFFIILLCVGVFSILGGFFFLFRKISDKRVEGHQIGAIIRDVFTVDEYIDEEKVIPVEKELSEEEKVLQTFFKDSEEFMYFWVIADTHLDAKLEDHEGYSFCPRNKKKCRAYTCFDAKKAIYTAYKKTYCGMSYKTLEESIEYMIDLSKQYLPSSWNTERIFTMMGGDLFYEDSQESNHFSDFENIFKTHFKKLKDESGWKILPMFGNHDTNDARYQKELDKTWSYIDLEPSIIEKGKTIRSYCMPIHTIYVCIVDWQMKSAPVIFRKFLKDEVKPSGKKVLVIGHFPPQGIWSPEANRNEYFKILEEYRDIVITTSFFGHEHSPFFYVRNLNNQPFHTVHALPSADFDQSGPALTIVKLFSKDGEVSDVLYFGNDYLYLDEDESIGKTYKSRFKPDISFFQKYSDVISGDGDSKEEEEEDRLLLNPLAMSKIRDYLLSSEEEMDWFVDNVFTLGLFLKDDSMVCSGRGDQVLGKQQCRDYVKCSLQFIYDKSFQKCFSISWI